MILAASQIAPGPSARFQLAPGRNLPCYADLRVLPSSENHPPQDEQTVVRLGCPRGQLLLQLLPGRLSLSQGDGAGRVDKLLKLGMVTGVTSIQNPSTSTRWGGFSLLNAMASSFPMVNSPPEIQTIPGEECHSLSRPRPPVAGVLQMLKLIPPTTGEVANKCYTGSSLSAGCGFDS